MLNFYKEKNSVSIPEQTEPLTTPKPTTHS